MNQEMTCLICQKKMKLKKEDVSLGRADKQYKRVLYWCENDDVWIQVEIPLEKPLA